MADKLSTAKKIAQKLAEKVGALSESEASKILEKYGTVEAATALRGPERQQYLNALDTVYGDRAKRAKDLGFSDSNTYYHGTKHDKPIEQFRASGTQEGDVAKAGTGVYLSANPEIADGYTGRPGDGGSIYPVKLKYRKGGEFEPDDLSMAKEIIQEQGSGPKGPKQKLRSTERGLHALQRTGEDPQDILRKADMRYSEDYGNIVVADPTEIRSTNAAFDPRFKDSPNILAAVGGPSMAGKIVNKMMPRPDMGLGQAAAAINEPLEKLNDISGRNELVAGMGSTAAKIVSRIPRSLDNLFSGFERPFSSAEQIAARAAASDPQHLQQQVEPVTQFGANLLVPQAQDMLMGPVGHTLGMAEKGSTAAEKLEQAVDKGFGRTAVVGDSVQPLGRVTVKDLPGETFKGNNQFGKTTVIDPKSLFEPPPTKIP